MKKIRNWIANAIVGIGTLLMAITWFSGICLHLYTVLFAYKVSGFIAALFALILPIIAQIYWVFAAWSKTGDFINGFSFYVFVYAGYVIASIAIVSFGAWLHTNEE